MAQGWEGKLTRLVALDRDKHFENCLRWMNDPTLTETLLVGDLPMSRKAEEEWFNRMMSGTQSDIVFAIETLDGVHIGNSGLHQIDYRHGFATSGSYIGDLDNRGQGYGFDAAVVRARYAFHVLGLRMLKSSFIANNEASRRMQEKVGYKVAGMIPGEFWKRGRYVDHVFTYLLRDDFQHWE